MLIKNEHMLCFHCLMISLIICYLLYLLAISLQKKRLISREMGSYKGCFEKNVSALRTTVGSC